MAAIMQQPSAPNDTSSTIEWFHAGVTACLRSWSALRTAVESGWGGGERESHLKAERLRQNILEYLNGKKTPSSIDVYDLADELAIYMEEEFSITLEDQSEQQVAETLVKMYEDCFRQNNAGDSNYTTLSLAQQLVAKAEAAVAWNHQFPVQVQSANGEDDDDDDEEMMVDAETTTTTASIGISPLAGAAAQSIPQPATAAASPADYAAQPLFGKSFAIHPTNVPSGPVRQLGEAIPEESAIAVEMDEDGFAPVVAKGKRNNRR